MSVNIFNEKTFAYEGMLDVYTSLNFIERYDGCGEFYIWFPLETKIKKYITGSYLVELDKERHLYGIMQSFEKQTNEKGVTRLEFFGKTTDRYLWDRIIWKLQSYSGMSSEIVYNMVDRNIVNPELEYRKVPNFYLLDAATRPVFGTQEEIQRTGGEVGEEITEILIARNLGFSVETFISQQKHVFSVYQGQDRSVHQSINPRIKFARSMDNILANTYERNMDNWKNIALIAGMGEGTARKYAEVDDHRSGLDRRELWVDARDLQDERENGSKMTETEYMKTLIARGEERLAECYIIENFSGDILRNSKFQYGRDYFMGDIVTFEDEDLGLQIDAKVYEAETTVAGAAKTVKITFGFGTPQLQQILARKGLI